VGWWGLMSALSENEEVAGDMVCRGPLKLIKVAILDRRASSSKFRLASGSSCDLRLSLALPLPLPSSSTALNSSSPSPPSRPARLKPSGWRSLKRRLWPRPAPESTELGLATSSSVDGCLRRVLDSVPNEVAGGRGCSSDSEIASKSEEPGEVNSAAVQGEDSPPKRHSRAG